MTINELELVVNQQNDQLYGFALKFTKDPDDADDLMQDTMVKAVRFLKNYQDGTNIKGWLFTIMRNTFINNYRTIKKSRALIAQEEDISSANLLKSSSRNQSESNFVMRDIKKVLTKIPIVYSIPFVRYVEGYKYQEIADELKIPIGTVKTRIFCARELLKKKLKVYKDSFN